MPTTILRLPQVLDRTGLTESTTYAMMARGHFPRPIKIGQRAVGWPSDVIEAWIAARIAEADGGEADA